MTPDELIARVRAGHRLLIDTLAGLGDDDVRAPSALPGWSRGHVITHLAEHASGVTRLTERANRGEIVEMYAGGRPARDAAIERGASRTAGQLREAVAGAVAAVEAAWADTRDWDQYVNFRTGPLLGLVYARWREVEIHLVDLDLGYRPARWSTDFCDHTVRFLAPRVPGGIALTLDSGERRWVVGEGDPVTARGTAQDLTAWLAGRAPDGRLDGDLPELAPWP
ncbi:maleylpyruvate isomerase family mycothiol-dependent enzyme [Bailinhaonella thermotolerans]|uniref:Maleylpyruvate isomerase family mycothiol-dependent enzyme n=1 Tax=Bailinhaonella thermotolerans TaxID=1070861 RepID=A0A3A4ASV4_9ACTN|nr:maleylpyruvate isomerase family mycothiol-dependent enzyme [Bailinhaonella thermotolerans]RJL24428.1 maleylpyruvate isomerase family mycothiol-dependent enzyme [Bailinhaonella thermotolerans]